MTLNHQNSTLAEVILYLNYVVPSCKEFWRGILKVLRLFSSQLPDLTENRIHGFYIEDLHNYSK